MSEFLKPQSPLKHKDGAFFYPLTTEDQVIMEDGRRLNVAIADINDKIENIDLSGTDVLKDIVYAEEYSGEITTVPLNADTLGGHTADEFLTAASSVEVLSPLYNDIESLKNSVSNLKFKALTTDEYEALADKDADTLYFII